MSVKFKKHLEELKAISNQFETNRLIVKNTLLKSLAKIPIPHKSLIDYHECLLFIAAHPQNKTQLRLVTKELYRLSNLLRSLHALQKQTFVDTGLPYCEMITRFSTDILVEMLEIYHCKVSIDSFEEDGVTLNTLLYITLPDVLKQETTAGLSNIELLDALGVKPSQRIKFLLDEFTKMNQVPYAKDFMWDSLKIYLNISHQSARFSRTFNVFKPESLFYHNDLIKRFNSGELINKALPAACVLSIRRKNELIACIRKSLLLTMRETDTATYMDTESLLLFKLERGIDIAIYGLKADRQLPYQSYIGYTAFKNGYPVAYGGSWVFGHTAMFGLNILETFRGGESGYIMCQLIRTYVQHFKLTYIEVENYQFGKDNPDGIKSGAFWFYYKFGFRPIDRHLKELAEKEFNKISSLAHYKSSEKTLIQLSESNIALNLGPSVPVKKEQLFNQVLNMITHQFKGNNIQASKKAIEELELKLGWIISPTEALFKVFEEYALWVKAAKIIDPEKLKIIDQLIQVKLSNALHYNQLVKALFPDSDTVHSEA